MYSAVIVDEAQDLSAAMVRMLHSLVGDAPDGLTLIGDGQQSIYPGGYTLAETGVSLAGRGVVLDVNYRNTAQILAFASRMVDGDEFADIEGEIEKGNRPVLVPRNGPEPVVERCASRARARRRHGGARPRLAREVGTGLGGIGVLCATNRAAVLSADALRAAGVGVVMLTEYRGAPVDADQGRHDQACQGSGVQAGADAGRPGRPARHHHPARRTRESASSGS